MYVCIDMPLVYHVVISIIMYHHHHHQEQLGNSKFMKTYRCKVCMYVHMYVCMYVSRLPSPSIYLPTYLPTYRWIVSQWWSRCTSTEMLTRYVCRYVCLYICMCLSVCPYTRSYVVGMYDNESLHPTYLPTYLQDLRPHVERLLVIKKRLSPMQRFPNLLPYQKWMISQVGR